MAEKCWEAPRLDFETQPATAPGHFAGIEENEKWAWISDFAHDAF